MTGIPDCLGITKARYTIEVEIKRSLSDFKANAEKHHVRSRDLFLSNWPKEFWFLVPESLALRASQHCPDWAGLAFMPEKRIHFTITKEAPINREAARLSVKECCKAFHYLSNQLHGATHWPARELMPIEYEI